MLTTTAAGLGALAGPARAADVAPEVPALSPAQRDWLARQRLIRWLPERDYAPFVSVGPDGQARGLSVEILMRIGQRLGLPLQPLPARPLRELLVLAQHRQGDLLTSLRATPERSAYLLFTRPYVSVPTVLVARRPAEGRPSRMGLGDLAGRPVAVGSGFAVEATVRAAYPAVEWRGVPSDQDGLAGVAAGRFGAAVVDAASAAHLMARSDLRGLAAVGDIGYRYELSFAVRSDWPVLREILDLGIAALPRADLLALRQHWLTALPEDADAGLTPLASGLGLALLAAGGLGAAGLAWRRRRAMVAGHGHGG